MQRLAAPVTPPERKGLSLAAQPWREEVATGRGGAKPLPKPVPPPCPQQGGLSGWGAGFLARAEARVWDPVRARAEARVWDDPVRARAEARVWDPVRARAEARVWDPVRARAEARVWDSSEPGPKPGFGTPSEPWPKPGFGTDPRGTPGENGGGGGRQSSPRPCLGRGSAPRFTLTPEGIESDGEGRLKLSPFRVRAKALSRSCEQ